MGKTSNRILSLMLSVLMILSMLSVFVIPASAQAANPLADAYQKLFNGENAILDYGEGKTFNIKQQDVYFINSAWTDDLLAEGNKLSFTFGGKTKTDINYVSGKHFNNYQDAYEIAYSSTKLKADNYFNYMPVFIFSNGEYNGVDESGVNDGSTKTQKFIMRAGGIILGANAGITPNKPLNNWNITEIETGGWAKNERYAETVLNYDVTYTTRTMAVNDKNVWDYSSQVFSGDGAKWAVIKEKAYLNNPEGVVNIIVDGVTTKKGFTAGGHDAKKEVSDNSGIYYTAEGKAVDYFVKNVIKTTADSGNDATIIGAYDGSRNKINFFVDHLRTEDKITGALATQRVNNVTFTNSYFANVITSKGPFYPYSGTCYFENTVATVEKCVFYKCGGTTFDINPEKAISKVTFNVKDNLLYNFTNAAAGGFKITNRSNKNIDIVLNVTGNQIKQTKDYTTTNTLFNGNDSSLITNGTTTINFNNNTVEGSVVAVPPAIDFDYEQATKLLKYDFNDNFYDTNGDGMGEPIVFTSLPSDIDSDTAWNNYINTNYYFNRTFTPQGFTLNYAHNDLEITKFHDLYDAIGYKIDKDTVTLSAYKKCGEVTPDMFEAAIDDTTIEIYDSAKLDNKVSNIDLSQANNYSNYYLKVYHSSNPDYKRVYKLNVESQFAKDFNTVFANSDITLGLNTFNNKNTAVFVANAVTEGDSKVAYGFIDKDYYKFVVDNKLVFDNWDTMRESFKGTTDAKVILPAGDYGDIKIDFALSLYGTTADISPVDVNKSAPAYDGSNWAFNNSWGTNGQTKVGTISIADGLSGNVLINGVTIGGQFNDTYRTIGKDGQMYAPLNISLKNIVVDQAYRERFYDQRSLALKNHAIGNDTSKYLFNLNNNRSGNYNDSQDEMFADGSAPVRYAGFGVGNADSFKVTALYIKDIKNTPYILNDYVAATTSFDTVYLNVNECNAGGIFGTVRMGAANQNTSFELVNSNFVGFETAKKDTTPFIAVEGISASEKQITNQTKVNVCIKNNVFYDVNTKTNAESIFTVSPAHISGFEFSGNTVFNTGAGKALFKTTSTPSGSNSVLAKNGAMNFNQNKFIGMSADNLQINFGRGVEADLTNTFVTTDAVNYLTAEGIAIPAMINAPYYLAIDGSVKSSDFLVSGISTNNQNTVTQASYYNSTKTMEFMLANGGTLADVSVNVPEGVNAKWYFEKELQNEILPQHISQSGTFYYYVIKEIAGKTYTALYTVNVVANPFVTPFAEAELSNRYFTNDAVAVSKKAVGASAGTVITDMFNGVYYSFVVGQNVFGTFADAYAATADVKVPQILVLTYDGDIVVERTSKIFGSNFETAPMSGMNPSFNAFATNGEEWTENFNYFNNQTKVANIVAKTNTVSGDIEIYGVTVTGNIYMGGNASAKRAATANALNLSLINSVIDTEGFAFGTIYSGATNTTDSFTLKNFYFKNFNGIVVQKGEDIIPANTTFDGVYLNIDGKQADEGDVKGLNVYLKTNAAKTSLTVKNSYLKGMMKKTFQLAAGTKSDVSKRNDCTVVYNNNVFYNYAEHVDIATIAIQENHYTDIFITNNLVYNDRTTVGAALRGTALYKTADETEQNALKNVTITGNKFVGYTNPYAVRNVGGYTSFAYKVKNSLTISDNYFAAANQPTIDGYKTQLGRDFGKIGTLEDGATFKGNEYYFNYDLTLSSSAVQIKNGTLGGARVSVSDGVAQIVKTAGAVITKTDILNNTNPNSKYQNPDVVIKKMSNGQEVESIDASKNDVYEVKIGYAGVYSSEYVVSIGKYDTYEFADAQNGYKNDTISNTALLVDINITEANGTEIVRKWDGKLYKFTVGQNAFKSVSAALSSGKLNEQNPQIIVTAHGNTEIKVTKPVKIYAKNWNRAPMSEMTGADATKWNGKGWTQNAQYTQNEVICKNFNIVNNVEGTVGFYGFTVVGGSIYPAGYQTTRDTSKSITLEFANIRFDRAHGTKKIFENMYPSTYTNTDTVILKNFEISADEGNTAGGIVNDKVGIFSASTLVLDGVYMNTDVMANAAVDTFRATASSVSTTIKNSYFAGVKGGFNLYGGGANDPATLTISNNIFNNFGSVTTAVFNAKPNCYGPVQFTNNFVYNPNNKALFNNMSGQNGAVITITGNKLLGFGNVADVLSTNNAFGSATTITATVKNNYFANDIAAPEQDQTIIDVYKTDIGKQLTLRANDATKLNPGAYYIDFDMTGLNTGIVPPDFKVCDYIIVNEAGKTVEYITSEAVTLSLADILNDANNSPYNTYAFDGTTLVATSKQDASLSASYTVSVVAQSSHSFLEYVSNGDATCEADGTKTAHCTDDGCTATHTVTDTGSATGHLYSDYTVHTAATCKNDGLKTRQCMASGCTKVESVVIPAVPHRYNLYVYNNDADCEHDGTMSANCVYGCGTTDTVVANGTAYGHFVASTINNNDATCQGGGTQTSTCAICKLTFTQGANAPSVSHKYNYVKTSDATCQSAEVHTGTCEWCGATVTKTVGTFNPNNHTWGEYVYDNNATCTTDGTKTAKCIYGCTHTNTILDAEHPKSSVAHTYNNGEYGFDANGNKILKCDLHVDGCPAYIVVGTQQTPPTTPQLKPIAFSDVKDSDWFKPYVDYVSAMGIINGVGNNKFAANTTLTRGMFVTILARIAGVDTSATANANAVSQFGDVAKGMYYSAAVKWASENGIVNGIDAKTFAPNSNITRQQLCTLIVRYANYANVLLNLTASEINFTDADKVMAYARESVALCQKAGIVNGYLVNGKYEFRPSANATRAEAAKIIYVFLTQHA